MSISQKESEIYLWSNWLVSTHLWKDGMACVDAIGVMIKCVMNWKIGPEQSVNLSSPVLHRLIWNFSEHVHNIRSGTLTYWTV